MKLKEFGKLILIFFAVLSILLIILIIVNSIPKKYIENNVKESVQTFINEGAFPKVKFAYNYLLDNYTDALMINTAYSVDSSEPIKSAILMRRNYRPNEQLDLEKIDNENNTIENLKDTLDGSNTTYYEYSRYWHGYMIYLRPFLVFFNYNQIRVIFQIFITILSILLIYFTYKKADIYLSLITLFLLIVANFQVIGMSLQYSSVFIIMLLASLYVLIRFKNIKEISSIFFVIGVLTNFFDLLTTPLLTLGIPAIYYIILKNREDKFNFKILFNIIIYWGLGYGMMWASKWIISDLLYQTGTISRVLEKITLLSNSTEQLNLNVIETIKENMEYINKNILAILLIFTIVSCLANIRNIKQKIPYAILAILPFIWFALIKNHSYIHARFTFRNLLITIFALSIITMENVKEYLNISKNNKFN